MSISRFVPGGNFWLPLLVVFVGYTTLNRGFAYIGHYPVFIGELTLLFYFTLIRHQSAAPKFLKTPAGALWLVFFSYSLLVFIVSATVDFGEAVRNSVYWVYTLFFYIGYVYGGSLIRANSIEKFNGFLLFCAKASVVYFAVYPFRQELRGLTSFLYDGTSLLGYYSTLHALSLGFVLFLLFHSRGKLDHAWLAAGLILIIAISQARASMLALAVIIMLLLVRRRVRELRGLIPVTVLLVIAALAYSFIGISIEGQRGSVTLEFFQDAVTSIFLGSENESLDGSRTDRLLWWFDIIARATSSTDGLFFGMGFNEVLVDRSTGADTILRYPHNSFVSIFGFSGLTGLMLYLSLTWLILYQVIRSAKLYRQSPLLNWYPIFFIGFNVAAFFSTVFEAPFHSFVFWVLSGVVYRLSRNSIALLPAKNKRSAI